jgi:hypothetical protein
MKRLTQKIFILLTLAVSLLSTTVARAESEVLLLGKNFSNTTAQGQSGGSIDTKGCGFISKEPNQVIEIMERIDYMKLKVQASGGQPTLLVDGPNGRLCAMGNDDSGTNAQISGIWLPGKYFIYVGDRAGSTHSFTLSVAKTKN